jgi:hypothetical protein
MGRPEPELPDGIVNVLGAHDLCSENATEAHLGCPKVTRPSLQNRRSSKLVGCSVTNDVGIPVLCQDIVDTFVPGHCRVVRFCRPKSKPWLQ